MQSLLPEQLEHWNLTGQAYQLVDVREEVERRQEELPSIHIPLFEIKERARELDQSLPVVLVCRSGKRSQVAARILQELGMSQVYFVIGGWKGLIEERVLSADSLPPDSINPKTTAQ